MSNELVPIKDSNIEVIKDRILEIRGQRVMLDRDLAELYGVETKGGRKTQYLPFPGRLYVCAN